MDQKVLHFNNDQFNRLFPFYILINEDSTIDAYGTSLEKLCANCKGRLFSECFYIKQPGIETPDFKNMLTWHNQLAVVELNNQHHTMLRGQFELLDESNQILFIGSPWFNSTEELKINELTLNDFACHDAQIDLLHILKSQELVNADLKHLLETVNIQKNELKKASDEIRNIALFPMQNPDPLLRICTDGLVLIKNPAAGELTDFVYQDKSYKKEELWKYIASKGDYITDRWTFEAVSNNQLYSFVTRYLPEQDYFNVYGRNITEQKENEEELLRISLLAKTNESGVLFTTDNGEIFWANESFCKMTGYTNKEIIGKKTLDFCKGPLADNKLLKKIAGLVGKTDSFDSELIHYRKDGTWFWGRVKGQSYKTGKSQELQYFAIVEDITVEKQKEEQLKILSQIAEDNINAVIVTDKLGYITWVNKSFTNITGYSLSEAVDKKPGHLLQGPKTDKSTIAYLKKQIDAGLPFNTEILNYTKSGASYWLRIQGQPILNNDGELTGFFALEENISDEKEVQEIIKKSEDRFRLVLEKIGDNVWEHDFTTGKTSFSKSIIDFLGYPVDESTSIENLWWDNVYNDDRPLLEESDRKYKNRETDSHNLEYRIVNHDGSIKWVLDRGVVIEKDEAGNPLRIIGTHTDISKIKDTETALEQRVKQFKSLSENIPGVIYEFEFRADGTEGFSYISPAVERVFGIKQADFYDYTKYIHSEDLDRIIQKNEYSKTTLEPFYDESRIIHPTKGIKWNAVHSSFSYISQTGSKIFTGFMTDITERKNIERALRSKEEKYRSIISNMKLGLLEVDNYGYVTYANQSFCEMSGYSLVEFIGKEAAPLFGHGKYANLLKEKQQVRKQGIADAYELETTDKAGNKKWWLISGGPRYNDHSELVGSIGIHLDITDQKLQEVELIAARMQAEQLAHTKEIFLANMSHEIRTPMNAIMGMSNQLAKSKLDKQQQFYLEVIQSASDNLLVIINDILDLSKIEAGKLSLENIGFELKAVGIQAMRVLAHKAEEKGLKLTSSFFDKNISPILIGDPYRLNQVLLNLMSNAIKFTEKGTIDLSFNLIENLPDSQTVQVQVSDTGIGMEEAFIAHLFDKFSQEYESVSRNYGGTGLGMSICKDLIELMGGTISVQSKKGEGSIISFLIKVKKGVFADLPEKLFIKIDSDFLLGKKILIADDNDMNRLVASIFLENYGAEIIHAVHGQQAVDEYHLKKPDVILMDIQMPVMNGFEATKMIRAANGNVPIIALTANAIKGENEKCIAAGMNDYVSKPFKEDDLLKTIAKWLGKEVTILKSEDVVADINEDLLYDLSSLKDIARGNDTFVEKMVKMFCEQTPPMIKEMTDAYYSRDLEKMGAIAHKIKPSIDNLNIISLKQAIRDIEDAGRQKKESADLHGILNETDKIIAQVIRMMQKEYQLKQIQ